jgi:hypothetical protein
MKTVHTLALIAHMFGLVLGVGSAALTDFLFVKCVRAGHVGRTLLVVIRAASNMVIIGYLALVASGIALLASGSPTSSRFWAKMFVVAVIGLNGTIAHTVIFPRLQRGIKARSNDVTIGFLHQTSVVAAVSGVSWATALVLGTWKTTSWPIMAWITVYLLALTSAICASLLLAPMLLRVDHPEFSTTFPILAPRALRANLVITRKPIAVPAAPPRDE